MKMMNRLAILLIAMVWALASLAEENSALRLVATIPLPNVSGRFDHSAVDLERQRLFITGRDADTIEVIDLQTGKHFRSLPGFPQPQGAYYVPFANKLFVSTRNDGTCKIINADSLKIIDSIKLSIGANVIAYDPTSKLLYIGHGGKQVGDTPTDKRGPGEIAIVDATTDKLVGNIETDPELRPGAIVVEQFGPRLFTTNALGSELVIIDRKKKAILSKWPLPHAERSGTVALDETRHRVFVGLRNPSQILVLDSDSGKQVASFPTVDGIDRLIYDSDDKRLYATGSAKSGEHQGSIQAYKQVDADHYELIARIPTGPDGGTSLLVPETGRLYVALPRQAQASAEIRVYATRP
jgi:DNA-binding beta-propeller fold protein YncE